MREAGYDILEDAVEVGDLLHVSVKRDYMEIQNFVAGGTNCFPVHWMVSGIALPLRFQAGVFTERLGGMSWWELKRGWDDWRVRWVLLWDNRLTCVQNVGDRQTTLSCVRTS